jgi:hypothetical protein
MFSNIPTNLFLETHMLSLKHSFNQDDLCMNDHPDMVISA